MTFDTAAGILKGIEASRLGDLRDALFAQAVRYARIRTDWFLADAEAHGGMDRARTAAHDCLIDDCNILSRNMAKAGEDIRWREALGTDRKEIGDFACHLHAILGLRAR